MKLIKKEMHNLIDEEVSMKLYNQLYQPIDVQNQVIRQLHQPLSDNLYNQLRWPIDMQIHDLLNKQLDNQLDAPQLNQLSTQLKNL